MVAVRMTAATVTLTDFLLDRIAEDEARATLVLSAPPTMTVHPHDGEEIPVEVPALTPTRVLAECEAKRRIVELHKNWPVLVETPPTVERVGSAGPDAFAFRASQQLAWMTEQEYRTRFGDEPPTAPMLLALAAVYADHPDYRDEWRP